jgi:hypothetical protein
MDRLRAPLMISAVYALFLGLSTLSPSITSGVFGYDVKDPGVLLVLSAAFLGFGVVLWGIASDVEKYGGLATFVVIAFVIFIVWLIYGWLTNLFTARIQHVLALLIIDIVLAIWIWSARPKS